MPSHTNGRIRFALKCFFLLLVTTVFAWIAYEQIRERSYRI